MAHPEYDGEFARHWHPDTAERASAGVADAPDFEVWAYGHADREPTPTWTVVVRQHPPAVLGWGDSGANYVRMFGIRFWGSSDDLDDVSGFEMLPGLDDEGLPFVHPHAPRVPFRSLPKAIQARTWIEAGDAWVHFDGRWFRWVPELREWYEVPEPDVSQYPEGQDS